MLIMMSTSITYTAVSMNQVGVLAETVANKQVTDYEQFTEEYGIVKISIDNQQFNMTVKNTGDIPVHLNRLWVENTTTASTWLPGKFELDLDIGSGQTVTNIGQNIGLTALDTQSYMMSLISERGNAEKIFLNSVGEESLYLQLHAFPTTVSDGFTTTLILEVVNNGTTKLLNLKPDPIPTPSTATCVGICSVKLVSGPTPSSIPSLDPGNTAQFEWVYTINGDTTNDPQTFLANLQNGIDTASAIVSVKTVAVAENANISIISGGLGEQLILGRDILIFHQETTTIDSGTAYQMYSGAADGGIAGKIIVLDTTTPHFVTNNGSSTITVPAGDWEIAMMLRSDPVGANVNDGYDMLFHFEDGDGKPPDNSVGQSNRDLMGCGFNSFVNEIISSNNDAYQKNDGKVETDKNDLPLACDGNCNKLMIVGVKFDNVDINNGEPVSSTSVVFQPRESDSGLTNLRIWGELPADGDADNFVEVNYNISDRTKTTAYVDWMNVPAWTNGVINSDTTTPDLSTIISEITTHNNWENGNDLVIIIEDHPTAPSDNQRKAEAEDGNHNPSATITIIHGTGSPPDWQANTGPHASGSYYFDGVDDCFRSSKDVTNSDGNNLANTDSTTSLWFKTKDNNLAITNDMYLVNWDDGTQCPYCEHYRILLTADATEQTTDGGKVQFHYSPNNNADPVVCTSTNEYDDNVWHHVIVMRDASADSCTMNIKNLDGTAAENQIFVNDSVDGSDIEVDGNRWNVGTNSDENGNFFKGWIDDVLHWDDTGLSSFDRDDVGRTNYGDGAHQFTLTMDKINDNGFVSNLFTSATPIETAFADSKNTREGSFYLDWDDVAYSQVNMTMNLESPVVLLKDERIEVYFTWTSSTNLWEALEVDMKIDDETMKTPYPTFMQIPVPDVAFPTYYEHDPNDEFRIFVSNIGSDGVYFTYQGTRVNFNGTLGSYAGLIHSANGTGCTGGTGGEPGCWENNLNWWNLYEDRDSLHVGPGEIAELYFHEATDIPSTTEAGTLMVDGSYHTTVWMNGYSNQGETFSRSITVGTVTVKTE